VLSRSAYRCGDTVCGTVQLSFKSSGDKGVGTSLRNGLETHHSKTTASEFQQHLRQFYKSATVHVSGKCRVDSRWHPSARSTLLELYGFSHPLLKDALPAETCKLLQDFDVVDSPIGQNLIRHSTVVCFFSTNNLELLALEERQEPKNRKALRLTLEDLKADDFYEKYLDLDWNHEINCNGEGENGSYDDTKHRHLAFTFQVDLPPELPPTIQATCCRYFYSAVLSVTTVYGEVITAIVPFTLLSCARMTYNPLDHTQDHISHLSVEGKSHVRGRVKVGQCTAVAHSNGLPCYVSPSTLQRRRQLGVSSVGLCSSMVVRDTRTVRITNALGMPTCILSIIGGTVMLPGGSLVLHFDFESVKSRLAETHDGPYEYLQCLQICVCLQGEEVAIGHAGTVVSGTAAGPTQNHGSSTAVTRTFLFDTGHSYVDAESDIISLSLGLPLEAPSSISTELVEINTKCHVEMTVQKRDSSTKKHTNKLEILQLDLPVEVVDAKIYEESDEEGINGLASSHNPGTSFCQKREHKMDPRDFELSQDILNDLTMLSIRMIEQEN